MSEVRKTAIYWGAGATATLGVRTTVQQTKYLCDLVREADREELRRRVDLAVSGKPEPDPRAERWGEALTHLLAILGDAGVGGKEDGAIISQAARDAMRANIPIHTPVVPKDNQLLDERIIALRAVFDWPSLQSVIRVCPGYRPESCEHVKLTDLFNILDMNVQSAHGFPVEGGRFLTPVRLAAARNCLKLLIQVMFFVDYQRCLQDEAREDALKIHWAFAQALSRKMQQDGLALARRHVAFDSRDFYLGPVSFISLNYDPFALWFQFVANRKANHRLAASHVGEPPWRLKVFHDLGHFVPGPRIETKGDKAQEVWFPMNETAAQRLNDEEHGASDRIRIGKFLFPHGCICWRECPNCGKLSSYLGDEWGLKSPTLIPPLPLWGFTKAIGYQARGRGQEEKAWAEGRTDARECVHCGTLTFVEHTQTIMQSNFKERPPSFIEEIQRDMRVVVQNADHIILLGYSLPPDDVTYRAFLAARSQRAQRPSGGEEQNCVKCSVVVGSRGPKRWLYQSEIKERLESKSGSAEDPKDTLVAARDLFGWDNVRWYGGGSPGVFADDSGRVTDASLKRLLDWNAGRS